MRNAERFGPHVEGKEKASNSGKVIVVRHAQSTANVSGLYTINNPALTDLGREQAYSLGTLFASEGITFGAVYTSGKDRATDTAHEILSAMNLSLPITTNERLSEKREGLETDLPGDFAHTVQKSLDAEKSLLTDDERWDYVPTIQGIDRNAFETERNAAQRMQEELVGIATSHSDETTLVVSHFMAMRAHIASLEGGNAEYTEGSLFSKNWVANTGFYIITPDATQSNGVLLQRKSLRRK